MATTNKRLWLKELREERKLTIREMADAIGMGFTNYYMIETGKRNPSIELSMKMAKYFNISIDRFLKDRVKFTEKNIG